MGGCVTFGLDATEIGSQSLRPGAAMALSLMDSSTALIMILERWSSDAFLICIRPPVLEWTDIMSNAIIPNDSFFNATDVPQADTDDSRTRRSLLFNGDRPISLGYTSSTGSEALRAPRRCSMVGVHHSGSGVCFAKLHLDTPTSWFLALIISSLLSAGVGLSAEVHMEEH
jgi:hypothetical protein